MKTVSLRLNDILTDEPIVVFDTDNEEIDKFLYDSCVGAYKYAYINADNKEQFYDLFTQYWNRNIKYTRLLLSNQIALGENLWNARLETREANSNQKDTPNYRDSETWSFGKTDTIEYGRTLEIKPDITETDEASSESETHATGSEINEKIAGNTQYSQQIVKGTETDTRTPNLDNTGKTSGSNTHTRNGTEEHINSGSDINISSGENTRTLNRTGDKTIEFTDNSTNKVVVYDSEKFYTLLRTSNVVDDFIDLFAPLFNDILMFSDTLLGGIY